MTREKSKSRNFFVGLFRAIWWCVKASLTLMILTGAIMGVIALSGPVGGGILLIVSLLMLIFGKKPGTAILIALITLASMGVSLFLLPLILG